MLEKEVQYIKGVGPKRAEVLKKLGITNLKEIIEYYPRGYEDRTEVKKISELYDDSYSLVYGILISNVTSVKARRLTIQKARIQDETGIADVTWFNQPYLVMQLKRGQAYYFYGKTKIGLNKKEILSPEVEAVKKKNVRAGNILPVYKLTKGLKQNALRDIVSKSLDEVKNYPEIYSDKFLRENNLIGINDAIRNIHFPKSKEIQEKSRIRLAFDELLITSLMLAFLKEENKSDNGPKFNKEFKLDEIISSLPFKLTNAQLRVLKEIEKDLEDTKSMDRLLQGDVGSGKTIIAILAAYKAVKSGYQVAMLAPTAILVMQHLENFKNILEKYDINISILRSGLKKKEKEEIIENIANGKIDIVIGTHAILEENVEFKNLGLVITDEQHRFGVKQRETIFSKGVNPNTLVMSATPIPRTLALILYGDLDISIIDELPPNRIKVQTTAVNYKATESIYNFIDSHINSKKKNTQAYVVCPLIEENEEMDLNSVEKIYQEYKKRFKNNKVAFMHGKMKDIDKDNIMLDFKNGDIDILVSTTVIEVGVDVPNANIMVIENAERFGLAQLHQLRGRIGRGSDQAYCILKSDGGSDITKERLKVMQETTNGFIISEKDLELRGSGDFFGTKQHGIPEFKIANLFTDMEILKKAQNISKDIIEKDSKLIMEENIKLGKRVRETLGRITL